MNKTIWSDIKIKSYPKLDIDISCDCLVIGGGISGILISYYLMKSNIDVVLVEMDKIGCKKTLKTTAAITSLQDVSYHELIKSFKEEKARLYYDSCIESLNEYKKLSYKYNFDFEEVSSYKYYKDDNDNYQKELNALKLLKINYKLGSKINLPIDFNEIIEFENQGQMNPMKLIKELSKDLKIYENTKIIKVKNGCAYTDSNKITANNIIISTGFPFLKLKGLYSFKMYQNKSFVVTSENKFNFKGNIIGSNRNDLYFRDYKDRLIIGGNDTKTGIKVDGYKELKLFTSYNNLNINHNWINQDCVPLDDICYIGRYSSFSDNMYVSTGFNLWGMTSAMTSAKLITDLILGKKNKYEDLFNPSRIYKVKPLLKNIGTSVVNLVKINGKRCNHLGCQLVLTDNCFECPCHGSKYDVDGIVVDGPAINDLNIK